MKIVIVQSDNGNSIQILVLCKCMLSLWKIIFLGGNPIFLHKQKQVPLQDHSSSSRTSEKTFGNLYLSINHEENEINMMPCRLHMEFSLLICNVNKHMVNITGTCSSNQEIYK